jgi:transposase
VARVVDEMVEAIPDKQLFSYYKGGGSSSYHPKMMLKVILYGYSQKVYACRGIEKLTKENLPAMWLAAMQRPDFRTINDFRGQRMKSMMDELYETMILKLIEDGYITMENYFLDGTKLEGDANKYSFVWKKSTAAFEKKLKEKIQETLRHIEEITQLEADTDITDVIEDAETLPSKLEEVATELEEKLTSITEELDKEKDTTLRKEIRKKRNVCKKPLKLIRKIFCLDWLSTRNRTRLLVIVIATLKRTKTPPLYE